MNNKSLVRLEVLLLITILLCVAAVVAKQTTVSVSFKGNHGTN